MNQKEIGFQTGWRLVGRRLLDELRRRLIARKVAPIFKRLPKLHTEVFDRVGHVDDFSDFRRIGVKWDELLPVPLPVLAGHRLLSAPCALFELCEQLLGHFSRFRPANRFDFPR